MSLILINFQITDLRKSNECLEYVKKYDHIVVAGSTFIVNTMVGMKVLRKDLSEFCDKLDELILVKLRPEDWLSFHLGAKRKWIDEKLS